MKRRELRRGGALVIAGAILWVAALLALWATLGAAAAVAVVGTVLVGIITAGVVVGPTRPRRG